jgi:hypothetical protein
MERARESHFCVVLSLFRVKEEFKDCGNVITRSGKHEHKGK